MDLASADAHDVIRVQGARENKLKGVDLELPKRRLTIVAACCTYICISADAK